ncbi:hypothetical protein MNBD_GAMMA07-812 [hydrothermal vent metagenome]|uniref:SoxXA-binding protein n=1 Tax=hydrothermal vent metagenome TaxID=652676 RepID=A0A3B0WKR8_9ZZZZ
MKIHFNEAIMKHAKIYAAVVLASVLLAGCASYSDSDNAATASTSSSSATKETYNAAVADAKKAINTAKRANYVWRDSGKILKKAAKAAGKGDYKAATKLANKAKRQGEMALAQSKSQASAGPL